jgi:hypothetical protein
METQAKRRENSGGMASESKRNIGQVKTGVGRTCRLRGSVLEALLSYEKYAVDLVGEGDSLRS